MSCLARVKSPNASAATPPPSNRTNTVPRLLECGVRTLYSGSRERCRGLPGSELSAGWVACHLEWTVSFYDSRQNRTDSYEYDFGSAPAISTTPVPEQPYFKRNCPASAGTYQRRTKTTYKNDSYISTPAHLLSLVTQQQVYDSGENVIAQTDATYDGTTPSPITNLNQSVTVTAARGNPTTISRTVKDLWTENPFTNTTGATVSETRTYDVAGNVTGVTDEQGNVTTFDYTDSCAGTKPDGVLGAFLKQATLPLAHTMTWEYDCYLGRPTKFTDRNAVQMTLNYETGATELNRLTGIQTVGGQNRTFAYDDTLVSPSNPTSITITESANQYSATDTNHRTVTAFDGFGRAVHTITGPSGGQQIQTSKTLDALGRVHLEYLPSYTTGGRYRQNQYDALGRVTQVTDSADSSSVKNFYSLQVTTTRDEDCKAASRKTDGLGRLTQVIEDPTSLPAAWTECTSVNRKNYTTTYTYDALDNLKTVAQGVTNRSFEYDSLKRLRKAVNPERGTTRYTYDANGNLLSRTEIDDAQVTMSYDAQDRLTSKIYSGPGSNVTSNAILCYDGKTVVSGACAGTNVTASIGKVSEAYSTVSTNKYTHDSLGRVSTSTQATPASAPVPYAFQYAYNLDGSLASILYPSSKTITTCYDKLGRAIWVSKTKTTTDCDPGATGFTWSDYYAAGAQYEAHGGVKQLMLGNGLFESTIYNGRFQPQDLKLGTSAGATDVWSQTYSYGTANNGNIAKATLTLPGKPPIVNDFLYDGVNRLTQAVEDGVSGTGCGSNGRRCQDHGYEESANDGRGNLKVTAENGFGTRLPALPSAFGTNNRIANAGWVYDGRGNLNVAPSGFTNPDRFLYDVEDHLAAFCKQSTACADQAAGANKTIYRYDAEGRRVKKEEPGGAEHYVRLRRDGKPRGRICDADRPRRDSLCDRRSPGKHSRGDELDGRSDGAARLRALRRGDPRHVG